MSGGRYDAVVIGAGVHGLIAASVLAGAGRRVLVVERRSALGGLAGEVDVGGVPMPVGAEDVGLLRPEIVEALELGAAGLQLEEAPVVAAAFEEHGELRSVLPARFGDSMDGLPTPTARQIDQLTDLARWVSERNRALRDFEVAPSVAVAARLLADPELLYAVATPVAEVLDQFLADGDLLHLLASQACSRTGLAPSYQGTGLLLLWQLFGTTAEKLRPAATAVTGDSGLIATLARVASARGVEIRSGVGVQRIDLQGGRAVGVTLERDETIAAPQILSTLDARQTLLGLVGARHLRVDMARRLGALRCAGALTRGLLVVDRRALGRALSMPELRGARLVLSRERGALERAVRAGKYERAAAKPWLELRVLSAHGGAEGAGRVVVTAHGLTFAAQGTAGATDSFLASVRSSLQRAFPNLVAGIRAERWLTARDYENEYGATEGTATGGELRLEQLFGLRPLPGCNGYQSSADGLFLCGGAAHPGGWVTGLPGWHGAHAALSADS